jgi:hypothetical protein
MRYVCLLVLILLVSILPATLGAQAGAQYGAAIYKRSVVVTRGQPATSVDACSSVLIDEILRVTADPCEGVRGGGVGDMTCEAAHRREPSDRRNQTDVCDPRSSLPHASGVPDKSGSMGRFSAPFSVHTP